MPAPITWFRRAGSKVCCCRPYRRSVHEFTSEDRIAPSVAEEVNVLDDVALLAVMFATDSDHPVAVEVLDRERRGIEPSMGEVRASGEADLGKLRLLVATAALQNNRCRRWLALAYSATQVDAAVS